MQEKLEIVSRFNYSMREALDYSPDEWDADFFMLELVSDSENWRLQLSGGQTIGWKVEYINEDITFEEYVYQCWNEFKRIVNKIEFKKENK